MTEQTDHIRETLRRYLDAMRAVEATIAPFFEDRVVFTRERSELVEAGMRQLEEAKKGYLDACRQAGWPTPET